MVRAGDAATYRSESRAKPTADAKEQHILPSRFSCENFDRWMPRDFAHRLLEQFFAGRNFVPGRGSRWMRQRDQVEGMLGTARLKLPADHVFKFYTLENLRYR